MRTRLFVLSLLVIGVGMLMIVRRSMEHQTLGIHEASVRQVLDVQVEAWNRGDLDAFMEGYRHGDELRFYSGDKIQVGWQATMDRYRQRYQADGAEMGQLAFDELTIDVLSNNAAIVRGRWHLTRKEDAPHGLFTLLVKRFPEGWRIVHDHTSAAS